MAKGYCQKHYTRVLRHGDPYAKLSTAPPTRTREEVVARALWQAERDGDCLIAQVGKAKSGHPRINVRASDTSLLHRLVLEVAIGRKLQKGEQANHKCHRAGCINPMHLYVGTQADNIRDAQEAGRLRGRHSS